MTKFKNEIAGSMRLCTNLNDTLENISFVNSIYVDENNISNFSVLTMIKLYDFITNGKPEHNLKKYDIYGFLKEDKINNFNIIYLGVFSVNFNQSEDFESVFSNEHNHIYEFNGFKFPNTGKYVIELFVSDNNGIQQIQNVEEMYKNVCDQCDLLDTKGFSVKQKG